MDSYLRRNDGKGVGMTERVQEWLKGRRNDGRCANDDEGAGMTCPRVILANAGIHLPLPS